MFLYCNCDGSSLIPLIAAPPRRMCTVWNTTVRLRFVCGHTHCCTRICFTVSGASHSGPSTSEWAGVCERFECLRRSLAFISFDRPDLPVIPVFLAISLCVNSHIHGGARGQQECDPQLHQSQPSPSSGAQSTGRHMQDFIISYWPKSVVILSAFQL